MRNREQDPKQEPSDGVPVPVADIADAEVQKNRLIVRDWWRTFVLVPALTAALAGCSTARAEAHTHRWILDDQTATRCCARYDEDTRENDDGSVTKIRSCGKWGEQVRTTWKCGDCGQTKVDPGVCMGAE